MAVLFYCLINVRAVANDSGVISAPLIIRAISFMCSSPDISVTVVVVV